MTPKIIMKVEFIPPKTGGHFFDYIDRKEATIINSKVNLNNISELDSSDNSQLVRSNYYSYMDRSKATDIEDNLKYLNTINDDPSKKLLPTFNKFSNNITVKEKEEAKLKLKQADKSGCNMWGIVLSFDNTFLKESGIIKDNILDQQELKNRIRSGMDEFLNQNGFNNSAFYLANIHLNTAHIHVHIALSETKSSRKKKKIDNSLKDDGYFKKIMIRRGKSLFYKNIESSEQRIKEIELLKGIDHSRKYAIDKTKEEVNQKYIKNIFQNKSNYDDQNTLLLKKLYLQLPNNQKLWRYKSNSKDFKIAKNTLNKLIDNLIESNPAYDDFKKLVIEQRKQSQKIYGENISKDISITKDKRLRSVIGNHILKEFKNIIQEDPAIEQLEKKNKRIVEIIRGISDEKIQENRVEIDKQLKELKDKYGNNFKNDRLSYKQMIGLVEARQQLIKQEVNVNSKWQLKELNKQLKNIDGYIKVNKNNPNKAKEIKQIEQIKSNFELQKIAVNIKVLNYSEKISYMKNLKLSPVQLQNLANQKSINKDLTRAQNYSFKSKSKIEDMIKQIDLQEKLIKTENLELFNVRTGKHLTDTDFRDLKKTQIKILNLKRQYIKNRYTFVNVNEELKKARRSLKTANKNDPRYKKLITSINKKRSQVTNLLKDRIKLEKQLFLTNKNSEVSDIIMGNFQKIITKPNTEVIQELIEKENPENLNQISKKKKQKNSIDKTNLDKAIDKQSRLNNKLSLALQKMERATGKQITNNKRQLMERAIEAAEQRQEMQEMQEEQVAQVEADRERVRAEQDEVRYR